MATTDPATQEFAVNLAALAREIAMDIFPVAKIIELHRLTDEEWTQIQQNPQFRAMLDDMTREWESASNVRERVKIKSATGLEMHLEALIVALGDDEIPLTQRVEAGKFLARLGDLDGQRVGGEGERFLINLNFGGEQRSIDVKVPKTIEGEVA